MKKIVGFIIILSILVSSTFMIKNTESPPLFEISNNLVSKKTNGLAKEMITVKELNILAIGDSLTEGVGDDQNSGGYLAFLQKELNSKEDIESVTIANFGVKGFRTGQLLKKLKNKKMINSLKYADIVLITIGGNDLMEIVKHNFTSLSRQLFNKKKLAYKENLHHIFTEIKKQNPNAKVYLIGMFNPFFLSLSDLKELDEIIADWNAEGKAVINKYEMGAFIPIADLFQSTSVSRLLADDNFHPNRKGYKLISLRVLAHLGYLAPISADEEDFPIDSRVKVNDYNQSKGHDLLPY
jgi:lysophospholipase L1-like esterase